MVKLVAFLPVALAIRNKRQSGTDTIVSSAQDAFALFTNTASGDSHGCHCTKFGSTETGFGGKPLDDRDLTCKDWNAARLCLELSGGVCENEATLTYTYNSDTGCGGISNSCQAALCALDKQFAGSFDSHNSAISTVADVNSSSQCPLTPENPMHDSCCGNAPLNYQRYNSERSRCFNGVVVITEDCPAGQQKNDNDVCEDCPANLYSNGRGRCVPCNAVADIVVIYDGSGSMTNDETTITPVKSKWWHQKQFVKSLAGELDIDPTKTRMAAMQYNQANKLNWWLSAGDTDAKLTAKVGGITQFNDNTCSTCSQIAKSYDALENFFGAGRAGLDAKRVVLALGDGINGNNKSGLVRGLNWMKANDVESFFIRIGNGDTISGHTWDELVEFEDNFIKTGTAGWGGLDAVAEKIKNKICAANASL